MTAVVSINTINGDDLTPAPTCRPVHTISQRTAILAFRSNSGGNQRLAIQSRRMAMLLRSGRRSRELESTPRGYARFCWIVSATALSCALSGGRFENCTGCKYANWYRAVAGLHPSGNGKCIFNWKINPLPAAFYFYTSPTPSRGKHQSPRKEFKEHCPMLRGQK